MSKFNEVIYRDPENESGSNLDYVRRSFYNLFKKMETSDSLITNERISNSFLFYSGLAATFLNTAAIYDGASDVISEVLEKIATWNIKNSISLAGAGLNHANTLNERGYTPSHATPFMCYAVDERYDKYKLPENLTVKRTESREDSALNKKMLIETFGLSEEIMEAIFNPTFGKDSTYRYVLYDKGTPVSTSLFLVEGDFAGCFDVATPAGHQRKGYGAELMKFMLKEQERLGTKVICLQSSNAGLKLYKSLGFQVIEYQQTWNMTDPAVLASKIHVRQ